MDAGAVAQELPRCPCGQVHRFPDLVAQHYLRRCIDELGDTVLVTTPAGSWLVPRVYIAAHGLAARDLPLLAAVYGWRRVP